MNPYAVSRPIPPAGAGRAPRPPQRVRETYLSVQAIAAELAVSKMTVYRLIENGELSALRVGRSLRVTESEFDRFLRSAAS